MRFKSHPMRPKAKFPEQRCATSLVSARAVTFLEQSHLPAAARGHSLLAQVRLGLRPVEGHYGSPRMTASWRSRP